MTWFPQQIWLARLFRLDASQKESAASIKACHAQTMWEPREIVRTLEVPMGLEGAGIYKVRLQSLLASTDNVLTTLVQLLIKSARHFCQGV